MSDTDIRKQEELDAKIKEAEEMEDDDSDLDDLSLPDDPSDSDDEDEEEDNDDVSDTDDSDGDDDDEADDDEKEKPTTSKEEKDGHGQSFKDKFLASTRESLVQKSQRERYLEKIEEANNLPEPTEEELKSEYSSWENMTETEKLFAKEALHSKKYRAVVGSISEERKQKSAWLEKSESFATNEETLNKYPQLRGKENDFLKFVSKDSRIGMDLDDAVNAWSYGLSQSDKKGHKGSLLSTGTSGDKATKKELSVSDIQTLRKRNFKKYQELVSKGKIDPLAGL